MPTSASPTRRTWLSAGGAGRAWPRSPQSRRCLPDWTSPSLPHRPRRPPQASLTLCCRLLQAAGRERARRRRLTTGLALLAVACAIALIVIVLPSSSGGPKLAPRAMAALVATPVDATIALQPRS